jgi:hypothetical protein
MTSVWISPEMAAMLSGAAHADAAPAAAPAGAILLRRSGGRPIRFDGMLDHEHAEPADEGERGHTIRIYETNRDGFVIEIALAADDGLAPPHVLAAEVGSLVEAEGVLFGYDPAAQAALRLDLGAGRTTTIAADAARFEREAMRLRANFEAARAAVFGSIDQSDDDAPFSAERIN